MIKNFPAQFEYAVQIADYAVQQLSDKKVNKKLVNEYRLLFEEIAVKMIEKAKPNEDISVEVYRSLGSLNVRIRCCGGAILLAPEDAEDFGGQILLEFSDYMKQSYSSGVNTVTFTASTASTITLFMSLVSLLSATVAAWLIHLLLDDAEILWLSDNVIYPVVLFFTRCMQTIAVPVAFFSLAAFLVAIYRTFDRSSRFRRLVTQYTTSSLVAIVIGVGSGLLFKKLGMIADLSAYRIDFENFMGQTVEEFLNNAVPSNIIEPFLSTNPLPMLIVAIFAGLSAGRLLGASGERVRNAINGVNEFFCCMINLVYSTIPLFVFFAQLCLLLEQGRKLFSFMTHMLITLLLPMLLVLLFDILRLLFAGVTLREFGEKYTDILWDNLKIGSNIEALPYNKRMLMRRTSLPNDYLQEGLSIGVLMNMDGNCAIIAASIVMMTLGIGIEMKSAELLGIALIIVLLSIGAPNQPGSFMLCMTVLMMYIGVSPELYADMLLIEALLNKFYSCLNSVGDIVTMVIEDRLEKKEAEAAK